MQRNKKLIYVSHCVLNQNSVINGWGRSESSFKKVVNLILEENISIIQLPCPELKALGLSRPPKTKDDYKEYRSLCKSLSIDIVDEMQEYLENNYKIIGIIGIEESPTCDTKNDKGIFMEELSKRLKFKNINVNSYDIPENYSESDSFFNDDVWLDFLINKHI